MGAVAHLAQIAQRDQALLSIDENSRIFPQSEQNSGGFAVFSVDELAMVLHLRHDWLERVARQRHDTIFIRQEHGARSAGDSIDEAGLAAEVGVG